MNNNDINEKLESLVMGRYTEEELNSKLSTMFGCDVEVAKYEHEDCVKEDIPELDDQFLFEIESCEVDVDLYYLVDNGGKYYITETCFN